MRTIGVVTVARSDYGIYLPVLRAIEADAELKLQLFVTGMHLAPEFGSTVRMIEDDGFEIVERVEMLLSSDSPEGIAKSMGVGTVGFSQAFARSRPDVLLVLGDRFEMHAAVIAALPFKIPVAHIHGGEVTEGAIDDSLRHSITKLSHLHFATTQIYADRVVQLGEAPWRVTVSGAPGLDNLAQIELQSIAELNTEFGLNLSEGFILSTIHSVTLDYEHTREHVEAALDALAACERPILFTMTNADTNGRIINRAIEEFVAGHEEHALVENLGTRGYFSAMSHAGAMVGNSSSGIIEAASLGLPVVNIGIRQKGRVRAHNVIDVGNETEEIRAAIGRALEPQFKDSLRGMENPYGDGQAAGRIVAKLRDQSLDEKLIVKSFHDLGAEPSP